ncbi:MAG: hypothetical protein WD691_05395 [Acidimicrobiales bacterium]
MGIERYEWLRAHLRRPVVAAAALLAVYVVLALMMDPRGYLGTDTGAKVATLEAMARSGSLSPDVGYWAEEWDPAGAVHPLYQSKRTQDGSWVAVTTLPLLEVAAPLYRLAGYRGALLLPMLGALGCSFAARALARRLGHPDGWSSFWVVGLTSPIALYALDFWEHSVGVALMLASVALLMDGVTGRRGCWRPLAAGALLGAAASLRSEAIVYALVAVGVASLVTLVRDRRPGVAVVSGVASLVGFLPVWVMNRGLELAVGGASRGVRAVQAAESATKFAGSRASARVSEGLVTTVGLKGTESASWLLGVALMAAMLVGWRASRRGDSALFRTCFVLVGVVYLVSVLADLSFIPGLFIAFPVAIGALLVPAEGTRGVLLGIALGALPLVWAFQYVGGAGAQWGGRYVLASSMMLGVLTITRPAGRDGEVGRALVVLSLGITVLGLGWTGVRTRGIDDVARDLASVDAEVLIVRDAFLLRETGASVLDEQWLTASGDETYAIAVDVAERSGARRVAVVEPGAPAPPPTAVPAGWVEAERLRIDFLGDDLGVVVYELPR